MTDPGTVIDWLLGSDPSVRWQVMRDLLDAPASEWSAERAEVEARGWGARLLSYQDEDGQRAGGAFFPSNFEARDWQDVGQPWTATTFSLSQLREFGLDPSSDRARHAVELIGTNSRWDEGRQPFWEGEVEECINGRTVADGALEYERTTGGTIESQEARKSGEEYLLARHLFRRLSTGGLAGERFLLFSHPNRWHYDVLRALDYFRSAAILTGAPPDPRLREAVDHLRSKRTDQSTWLLDRSPAGRVWFEVDDGVGQPSRWLTLRAMRVLRWWEG